MVRISLPALAFLDYTEAHCGLKLNFRSFLKMILKEM
jgi:hypothetical protein